jgi:hypothetical protein
VRLLLDEHLDPQLARQLRDQGHDVIAVAEQPALRGLSDAALLDWAAAHGRAIATYDVAGFLPIAEEHQLADQPFAGIIAVSTRAFPLGASGHGRLLRALAAVLSEHRSPKAFAGLVVWLESD